MNFILNEIRTKKIDCNNSTFQDVGPYQIDDAAKIGFELNFKKGGKIWIRFPLQNQPPSISENFPSYIESQAKFVVDSEAELNDAINNSSKNKLIYLKFGEFKGPFYINNSTSNLQIKAHPDERHEPILCGNGGDFVLAIEDSSNISIDGLKIKNAINGILLEDDMNCSISNCVIREFILDGISLNNSTNIKIEDNDIASLNSPCNITGINLTQCKNKCEVINNEIELDSSANIPIDILLDESGGNIIKISPKKEDGYNIYENKMNWLIQCNCCLNSLNDTCDCNDFIDASDNSWTLCGETL